MMPVQSWLIIAPRMLLIRLPSITSSVMSKCQQQAMLMCGIERDMMQGPTGMW